MQYETRSLTSLTPWEKNPRGILKKDYERLKKMILKFKLFKPFLITKDGIILGGNMRYKACQELKITEVPCSVVDAPTDTEKLEYALADNDRVGYYEKEAVQELALSIPSLDLELFHVDLGNTISLQSLTAQAGPDDTEQAYMPMYQVVIECQSEEEQQRAYTFCQQEGYTCKVLTL